MPIPCITRPILQHVQNAAAGLVFGCVCEQWELVQLGTHHTSSPQIAPIQQRRLFNWTSLYRSPTAHLHAVEGTRGLSLWPRQSCIGFQSVSYMETYVIKFQIIQVEIATFCIENSVYTLYILLVFYEQNNEDATGFPVSKAQKAIVAKHRGWVIPKQKRFQLPL